MKSNIYKITFEASKGAAFAAYENGVLRMLLNELADTPRAFYIYATENSLDALRHEFPAMSAIELIPKTVAEKVAVFCILHKEIKGFVYRAGKEEKANLKLVTVSRELLEIYFSNTAYPMSASKSMADYVKHYNYVRDMQVNGVKAKAEFPDVYDREFERRISEDPGKLQRYWAHLRARGWRKVDDVWRSQESLPA